MAKRTPKKPNPKKIITPKVEETFVKNVEEKHPIEEESNWHIIDKTFWGETRVMEFGNGLLVMASTNQGASLAYVPNMTIIEREGKKVPVRR